MPAELPDRHPVQTESVHAAMQAVYNWNYGSEIEQLRTLYANALERQWIGLRDLDWDAPFDREAFSRSVSLGGFPIQECARIMVETVRGYEPTTLERVVFAVFAPEAEQAFRAEVEV